MGASSRFLAIDAGTVLTPAERFSPGRVVIRNNVIEAAGFPSDVRIPDNADRIDAPQMTLVPGFIEPHIHGCGGVDVMDASLKSLNTVSRVLASHGTTSFLPTTVSTSPEILGPVLDRLGDILAGDFDGARPLGIHLEGPFISVQKRGTHQAIHIQPPNAALFTEWLRVSHGTLKLLTMAPELPEVDAVAVLARNAGVVVAMGHSDASFAQATSAADSGTHYAVHTFNAMRPFTHRDSGIVGAALADDRIFAEIIADGVHVSPEVIRIFARAKGRDRVLLVTDATSATDMPDGEYFLGTDLVHVAGGICRDRDGRLAGSTLTQDTALRNFMEWTGMRLEDALLGLTINPAIALNLEGRGRIEAGVHADMVMLDENVRVMKTIVGGKLVFERHADDG